MAQLGKAVLRTIGLTEAKATALHAAAVAVAAGRTVGEQAAPAGGTANLYAGFDAYTRKVTTASPEAQRWFDQGLRFFFEKGRVVRVETDGDQALLDAEWNAQTGDKDRLGEFVLGCNPLLKPVPGSTFQPYYGFGDGVMRLTIGENIESGGRNRSSLHRWLMLIDGTVKVGSMTVVKDGRVAGAYAA